MNDKRPRGRPRPSETVERDRAVLEHLRTHGPQTRNTLADTLGIPKVVTYLSLNRLRLEGLVTIGGQRSGPNALWTVVEEPQDG